MKRVERSTELSSPAERVFDYLASIENVAEWQSGTRAVEQTSSGPVGVGTTAVIDRTLAGQRITAPLRITEFERPRPWR